MAGILEADCPRCGTKQITFDVTAEILTEVAYNWQRRYEVFAVCRRCRRASIIVIHQSTTDPFVAEHLRLQGLLSVTTTLNSCFAVADFISLKDREPIAPPEFLPPPVEAAFNEGAKCLAINCYNAAGTMFRLAIDLATRPMLPPDGDPSISHRERRDLGARLPWLFSHERLQADLQELAAAVREDGNDGAHHGTLTQHDAEDLLDFATSLLERIFTEPARIEQRKGRREQRRKPAANEP